MIADYWKKADEAIRDYAIIRTPFSKRTVEEVFEFATRYVMPFVREGQGKGFQDAVILLSILDHLNQYPDGRTIFITADAGFKEATLTDFLPAFDAKRLRIVDKLDTAFDELWRPYFDATVMKPYKQEVESAKAAAQSLVPELTEFVKSHLTEDMIKPGLGDKILKILSVENLRASSVDTPLPKTEENLNRSVLIQINVSADCTILVSRDLSYFNVLLRPYRTLAPEESNVPPLPEELEIQLSWSGGIKATADIADGQFKNIVLQALVPEKENK